MSNIDREECLEVKDWNELFEKLREIYDEWILFLNPEEELLAEELLDHKDVDVIAYVYDGYFE